VGGNRFETAGDSESRKGSLGELLIAARERRGLSRDTVVQQTHIPAHYIQMLEDDDYHRIADELYLLPFLRKYASFLDIDPDESAMRLVREVQRVDNSPSPLRLDESLDEMRRYRRRNWTKPLMFGALIAVIIGAYIAQSHHSDTDSIAPPKPVSSQNDAGSFSSFLSNQTINTGPAARPARAASTNESDLSARQ
jgi:cytoskeletal protein RodZ